jgi:hypothetical protein
LTTYGVAFAAQGVNTMAISNAKLGDTSRFKDTVKKLLIGFSP